MINGTIVFSSEPKGCFCFPGVKAELDVDGLNEILSLGPGTHAGKRRILRISRAAAGVLPDVLCFWKKNDAVFPSGKQTAF